MKPLLLFLTLFFFSFSSAQVSFPISGPVFKDDVIPRIDILIPPDSLAEILKPGNELSDYHWHATFIFDNEDITDTVYNAGFRLRGNTSRFSKKKSFKVSFNTYEPGREWHGLEKLNINGEHNDPTICRSKICWDMLRDMGVPAPRANHVDLYINGEYFGLYANVEHVDEDFVGLRYGNQNGNLYKCLWPADLDYLGDDPDLYKFMAGDRRAYDLRINDDDDYSDLAHFIDVLNNTSVSELPCDLEKVFNMDSYLQVIAFDILSGNWDGPLFNKNNFYLYHNEATGKFEYIPFDLDNTLGIDWLNMDWVDRDIYQWGHADDPRPLYWRLMDVPEYEDRFSYYMNKFVQEIFHEDTLFSYINSLESLITTSAIADPFRPLDYGFTVGDFHKSFEEGLPFFHTPYGLEEFITLRRGAALDQLELNDINPIITQLYNNNPKQFQDIHVTAMVEDDEEVQSVEVCYQWSGQGGNLTCTPMYDSGFQLDGAAGDGRYGRLINAFNEEGVFEYFIKATDNNGQESRKPVCGTRQLFIGSSSAPLAINEFMADNDNVIADEAGDYDDWVEIYSLSDVPIYLGNRYLSDNENGPTKWRFPEIWIQPGEYILVWTDNDEDQGDLHTNFKLDADGEFIGIFDDSNGDYALIDGYEFGAQETDMATGRYPNGTGPFQLLFPTPGASNQLLTSAKDIDNHGVEFLVYPNPTSGKFWIGVSGVGEMQERIERVEIMDGWGKMIKSVSWMEVGQEMEFNPGVLPAGIYLIRIVTKDKIFYHFLVVV